MIQEIKNLFKKIVSWVETKKKKKLLKEKDPYIYK